MSAKVVFSVFYMQGTHLLRQPELKPQPAEPLDKQQEERHAKTAAQMLKPGHQPKLGLHTADHVGPHAWSRVRHRDTWALAGISWFYGFLLLSFGQRQCWW